MILTEMHVMFRQFAQQMGLQNVRAILPEQIDLLLNASISDIVNQLIQNHLSVTSQDGNTKLGQINALTNLYKTYKIDFFDVKPDYQKYKPTEYFNFSLENKDIGLLEDSNAYVLKEVLSPLKLEANITYTKGNLGLGAASNNLGERNITDKYNTPMFPIRIVDYKYLANALNDDILKPKITSPIAVITDGKFNIYLGKLNESNKTCFVDKDLIPYILTISYIKSPTKLDISKDPNFTTEVAEHLHVDIVKHAVELWMSSVGIATQQSNNKRNDND